MAVTVKSAKEIELMREAGRRLEIVHDEMAKIIRPGISTMEINEKGDKVIRELGCKPNFLPKRDRILKEGDIVSLDAGLIYKGYHSDAARTHAVGQISPEAQKLLDVTKQSFFEGIKQAKAGNHLFDISAAIDDYVSGFGYGIVQDLVGHGIGTELHEDPQIPNFRQKRRGIILVPGMTLAIEPMVNMGTWKVRWLDDEWTVISEDHSLAAHYENTILITDGEPEILTLQHA